METLTTLERVAQEAGYPTTLFGYTPNEFAYWLEPHLPSALPLLNPAHHGFDPVACAQELAGLWLFCFEDESMAPRFRRGMAVAGRSVAQGSPLPVGHGAGLRATGRRRAAGWRGWRKSAPAGCGWPTTTTRASSAFPGSRT